MTSSTEAVRYELADGVVNLILDDPSQSANTMNQAYADSMAKAVEQLAAAIAADPESIKGVIVSSAKKTFFAGGDLKLMTQAKPEDAPALFDNVEQSAAALRRLTTGSLQWDSEQFRSAPRTCRRFCWHPRAAN